MQQNLQNQPMPGSKQAANANSSGKAKLTQAERTEISDQKMFYATVKLIVERGTAGTSLKEVGVLAGYSRGLASHRFGSKAGLFSFTLAKLGEIWLRQLKSATKHHVGLQAVERAVDQHYQFCVDAPEHVRTFYMLWFESVNADSELSESIKSIHNRRHLDVIEWIESDPSIAVDVRANAPQIAAQFAASIIGIVYFWLANPDSLEETKELHRGLKSTMRNLIRN